MYQINVKADGSVLIRHVVHVPHVVAADQFMPTLVRGSISRPIFCGGSISRVIEIYNIN